MRSILFLGALACASGCSGQVTEEPCGTNEGDKICDVSMQAYVRGGSFADTTLHAVLAASTEKYALIFESAAWCSPCKASAQDIGVNTRPDATRIGLLVENVDRTPATRTTLDVWVSSFRSSDTSGIDKSPGDIQKVLGPVDTAYVVERATRKILVKRTTAAEAHMELLKLP